MHLLLNPEWFRHGDRNLLLHFHRALVLWGYLRVLPPPKRLSKKLPWRQRDHLSVPGHLTRWYMPPNLYKSLEGVKMRQNKDTQCRHTEKGGSKVTSHMERMVDTWTLWIKNLGIGSDGPATSTLEEGARGSVMKTISSAGAESSLGAEGSATSVGTVKKTLSESPKMGTPTEKLWGYK